MKAAQSNYTPMVLKYMYIVLCFLSFFMVCWIVVFPSSWLTGRSKLHADLVQQLIPEGSITPPDIVEKYAKQTAIHLTHTLPGAVWAGLIPFQLHKSLRKNRPVLHRRLGYLFFLSSMAMTIGIPSRTVSQKLCIRLSRIVIAATTTVSASRGRSRLTIESMSDSVT